MDEAYSCDCNNSRDASTITTRKEVQHLVMRDNIKQLPDLHGLVQFPDVSLPGDPAQVAGYLEVAKGFERVTIIPHLRGETPA